MKAQSVIVVEDIAETLAWLTSTVNEVFPDARIASADSLATARQLIGRETADLFLLDLGLPDGSGLALIEEIRADRSDNPYIVVTTIFDDRENLKKAFRLGANGYLLKDDGRDEIVKNLRGILVDRPPVSARSLDHLLDDYRPDEAPEVALTTREEDLLRLIATGCTVAQAAEKLGLTANTVKGYLKNIYAKLGISSRAEATSEAIRRKLLPITGNC